MKFLHTPTILFFLTIPLWIQAQDLEQAKRFAETGKHFEAELIYNILLDKNPDDLGALIGAGYNYSWSGQNDRAAQKFEAALAIDPNNGSALVGKGYNLAWSKKYAAAKYPFMALERMHPGSVEARKGLGYVYLWQGNGDVAIDYFEKLVLEYPKEIEYYIALAQSYLIENRIKKARLTLRSAMSLDPNNMVAQNLYKNTFSIAAPLELDIWSGYSNIGDMGKFSLRTVQVTGAVSKKMRLYLKYDNSLTTDLAALVRKNQEAQAFSGGSIIAWNKVLTSRFEYGARLLPDNITQQIFSTEQVYFLPNRWVIKGGGFFGQSTQANDEWMSYISLRIPMMRYYSLEPHYFYSRTINFPFPENRFMLNNQFRNAKGYELGVGMIYGIAGIKNETGNNNIFGGFISGLAPFSQNVWAMASIRYEKAPFDKLTSIALGAKIRLEQ